MDGCAYSMRSGSLPFPLLLLLPLVAVAFRLPPDALLPAAGKLRVGHRLEREIGPRTRIVLAAVPMTQETNTTNKTYTKLIKPTNAINQVSK